MRHTQKAICRGGMERTLDTADRPPQHDGSNVNVLYNDKKQHQWQVMQHDNRSDPLKGPTENPVVLAVERVMHGHAVRRSGIGGVGVRWHRPV